MLHGDHRHADAAQDAGAGTQTAFVSAGGYHRHIGLNTWESLGGAPPPSGTTDLCHVAILYPTWSALADALRRVLETGIQLDGASDHGVSEALYLRDPDENGEELYWLILFQLHQQRGDGPWLYSMERPSVSIRSSEMEGELVHTVSAQGESALRKGQKPLSVTRQIPVELWTEFMPHQI